MTPFMRMREHIRRFVHMHEIGFFRVLHGLYMLVSLVVIAGAFPFATGLNRPWIIAALSDFTGQLQARDIVRLPLKA